MQAALSPIGDAGAPPSGAPGLRLPARLGALGSLFVVELLLISVWLDSEMLRGRGALATLVHDWGAWGVHFAVAIVLGSLIFAGSRAKNDLRRISEDCAPRPLRWPLLAAHAAAMILFLGLSSVLFHHGAGSENALVLAWGLTGAASLALAACGIVPVAVWTDLFRSTGDAWVFALGAAFLACALGTLAQSLWVPLSHWTLGLVEILMRPFVTVLVIEPSTMTIGTPAFNATIAPQCSGYEGMGLMLAFSSAWLWFFRRQWRFPQALLLIPAGVGVIWVANAARIAALLLLGNAGWPRIAEGGFHSQAGWMAFNAVAIGTCVLAQRIPALVRHEAEPAAVTEAANPTVPYLMPFLAILAAGMIARSLSGGFEWFYSLRVAAGGAALWYFRRDYKDLNWKDLNWRTSWFAVAAGTLVFAVWMALDPGARAPEPAALLSASVYARFSWIALRILGGVVMAPIAEELAFRGFLMRRLISSDFESVGWRVFSWAPFLISSAAFGILHGDRWLAGMIAGAFFALAQLRRGRIGDAIVAHASANALVALWVLARGNWQLW